MATAIPPLRFDPEGLFVRSSGVSPELVELVHPQLEAARSALLGGGPSAEVELVEQPDRIIADYRAHRERSELGQILATAGRLAESVDRVVVVADSATLRATRALVNACSHPYHNDLSRAERGGQPRMHFAGDSLDNDALAGLVDLVQHEGHVSGPLGSWGLILIDDGTQTTAFRAARNSLLMALEKATAGDRQQFAKRCVSIAAHSGGYGDHFAHSAGDRFELSAGAGGYRSLFDAAGLLPAAVLGIDVRRLLEGAARLNAHFREVPAADNVVLGYVGACHLMRDQNRAWFPALVPWADGLRSLVPWHEELPSALHGSQNTRTFPLNLLIDHVRRDRISVGPRNDGSPAEMLPDALAARVHADRQRAAHTRQPWAALHVPRLDAPSIGQLFQLFLIAPFVLHRLPWVTQPAAPLPQIRNP